MWYLTESNVKPEPTDTTSSNVYNYDRKNITSVEREDIDGHKYAVYVYEELKVKKADWLIYIELKELNEQQSVTDQAIQDIIMSM